MVSETEELNPQIKTNLKIGLIIGGIIGLSGGFGELVTGAIAGALIGWLDDEIVRNSLLILEHNTKRNYLNKIYGIIYGFAGAFAIGIILDFLGFESAMLIGIFTGPIIGFRCGARFQDGESEIKGEIANAPSSPTYSIRKISKSDILLRQNIDGIDRVLHSDKIIDGVSGIIDRKIFNEKGNILRDTFIYLFESKDITGSVVLTPNHIVFYSKAGWGKYQSRKIQVDLISYVSINHGLFADSITFETKSAVFEIRKIKKNNLSDRFIENVKLYIEPATNNQLIHNHDVDSVLSILRETEFYQGFIRFKMSVANTIDFVVYDVTLDFDFDDLLLQINNHEPDYSTKHGKILLGNISGNSSKTIAIYLDPMMCSKGTDINCQINYKDAKGQSQSTQMEPKKISVVCPIMKTDSDINIGRLKEFVENLPHRDSKVYQLQAGFNIEQLKNITHEIVQKHDVKHIRTLHTKDGGTCEIWYYGKTKVNHHNIVIRITISGDTQSIELFAATPTPESLAGLLAEVGREIKSAIDAKTAGDNVKQVLNVTIKDSIIQRSNLLSFCDINGNCTGDVVIEDSIVQRSGIGLDMQADANANIPAQISFDDSKMMKKNKITEDVVIPNKEITLINKNLEKMNKYGAAALKSVRLLQSSENKNPIEAWDIGTREIFGHGTSSQKKGCPKSTFLGLCEEGLIKGVPRGNYTNSKENKKYALKAVEILKNNPHFASNKRDLWNEVVDEPKSHNSQMDVVIALWNNDFIDRLDVVSVIKKRFVEVGNPAQIPLLRGDGSFEAKLSNDGIHVDNLGNLPFLPWKVFTESISLLCKNGGNARRGDAMNSKLGDEKLSLNSIEGHIAHVVYGKKIGDTVFRRITPIACILIWAKFCQHKRGGLLLSNDCTTDSDCMGNVVIEDSIVQRSGIKLDAQIEDSVMLENAVSKNSCPACDIELPDSAKFCLECGEKIS